MAARKLRIADGLIFGSKEQPGRQTARPVNERRLKAAQGENKLMKLMKHIMIALVLCAIPAMAFGQIGSADPAMVNVDCPDDECHTAPIFKGQGGFVGAAAMDESVVTVIVSCGAVTTSMEANQDDEGIVRQLFTYDNGLACDDGGSIDISGLADGGWYWIQDETNAAVSSLYAKDTLGDDITMPTNPGGVEMTVEAYATYVRDPNSGRVGIIPHVLPMPPMPACSPDLQNNCMVNAAYSLALTDDADEAVGDAVERGAAPVVVTPSVAATGNLEDGTGEAFSATIGGGLTNGVTQATGTVTIAAAGASDDRCLATNIDRGTPIMVTVSADTSGATGYIPEVGALADRSFMVTCPPVAAASNQGVDLVPENPFPVGR